MDAVAGPPDGQDMPMPAPATVVVDRAGAVAGWSHEAARLLARPADAVTGRPLTELLSAGATWGPGESARTPRPGPGRTRLRHAHGNGVDVAFWATALAGEAGALLINFVPADTAAGWGQGTALLRSLMDQKEIGIALRDTDLRLERTNITSGMFGAPAMEPGDRFTPVVWGSDAAVAESILTRVVETGVPVVSWQHKWRSGQRPPQDRTVSVSAFRLQDARSEPSGVAVVVEDVTEPERIRRQRELLHSAATRIGFSLDARNIAQALADVISDITDFVAVDLTRAVLTGVEPAPAVRGRNRLVRAAAAATDGWPERMLDIGEEQPPLPDTAQVRKILRGHPVVLDRQAVSRTLEEDEHLVALLVPDGAHSLMVAPLFAHGILLGAVSAWRTEHSPAFQSDEVQLLKEISSRAALGIDNARRYAYQHRAVAELQARLLPRAVTDLTAAHTVGAYASAGGGAGVGGDWFDVIALPSLRVAFVVGDVVGHGLPAAAGMGRLRTAVQNFATLELEPTEVLAHMEDLMQRLAAEIPVSLSDTTLATCLFAVYDPTTRQCTFASAGQPPPVVVRPDGGTEQVDVPQGPPLGVGGVPYESSTITLEPGSVLALFTDGLPALRPHAHGDGVGRVEQELGELCRGRHTLEETGEALLAAADRTEPRDDAAVLLARTHAVDPDAVAAWEFPAEAGSAAEARAAATRQLDAWGLADLSFTTELVVSELVTNAVRYAWGPIRVRLIRDEVLICEVSDHSNTQPRLMRAGGTDEGGRGLFIVAQCTTRWGCRYGRRGKTIWTEQPLDAVGSPLVAPEGG
ncbi:hypothetical protein GCM10018793_63900 [Streptomyces sulfonofaciens]|uniref:Uncharacterized protein n=1 Tax=Streptomyces sulfonofaciens TaxID=68272 RepID=A0A919GPB3_9ACTN|nr:SpoIIE family protein phosphatase [Streptomyces sulfonofaciens]GHH87586.1 hypothetical protein GCM10018793_63900 [Streptomyces sulfonofaciens]